MNKKFPGLFKDDVSGEPIAELVGLRSKFYRFRTVDNEEKETCKGIKQFVIRNGLRI